MTAKQRKYFGKKKTRTRKRRSKPVSKKRRGRRRGSRRVSRRGGGGGGRGIVGKILPSTNTLMDAAGAGIYGKLESMAKADANNVLNKIPRPISQLGYAGGTALALHLINAFFVKSKYLGHLVNGVTSVAAYQMGRGGGLPTDATTIFTVAGDDDDVGAFDDDQMNRLAGEGDDLGDDDDIGDELGGLDVDNPGGLGADEGLSELGD